MLTDALAAAQLLKLCVNHYVGLYLPSESSLCSVVSACCEDQERLTVAVCKEEWVPSKLTYPI